MASRDFLRFFGTGTGERAGQQQHAAGAAGQPDDVELSLDLSLGGRFGTDAAKRPRLARSSSIASVCSVSSLADADADADPSPAAPLPLLRTSSLPTETEEERWRRRDLEARRKRVERRNSMGSLVPAGPKPPHAAAAEDATAVVGDSGRRSNAVCTTELRPATAGERAGEVRPAATGERAGEVCPAATRRRR